MARRVFMSLETPRAEDIIVLFLIAATVADSGMARRLTAHPITHKHFRHGPDNLRFLGSALAAYGWAKLIIVPSLAFGTRPLSQHLASL